MSNCTKESHRSKGKAKQAAYAIKAKGYIGAREFLTPYYCKSCDAWHLSKITATEFLNKVSKHNK